jgi:hypothetical protein
VKLLPHARITKDWSARSHKGGVLMRGVRLITLKDLSMTHPMFTEDEIDVYEYLQAGMVVARDTAFGKIYVDLHSGQVTFVQRWKYYWELDEDKPKKLKASPWTDDEQCDFHYAAKSIIWKFWNSHRPLSAVNNDPVTQELMNLLNQHSGICFNVTGDAPFAKQFSGQVLPIEFDVHISVKRPHYRVHVRKMLPNRFFISKVDESARVIRLDTFDNDPIAVHQDGPGGAVRNDFVTTPHEFGHAIGYSDDEYTRGSVHRKDVDSLMNIGQEIRPRHLRWINQQLNHMLPGCRFKLPPA